MPSKTKSESKVIKDPIVKRLDALISLQMEFLNTNAKISYSQMYKALHVAGLTPSEIGGIVSKSGKDVSAYIAQYEKSLKKNKTEKKENNNNV